MSDTLTETPAVETTEQPAADSLTTETQAVQENSGQDDQGEQQPDFESQFDAEMDQVSLDNFDLEDLEDYQKAILDLTKKKRKAYDQAKRERLAKEALQKEIEDLRSSQKMAENEELEALRLQLQAKEQEQANLLQELQQEKSRQADMMFDHAAELHKAKERDFLKFKLQEHLKSADTENFSINSWMEQMKQNHPAMFDEKEARKLASTTNNTQHTGQPASTQYKQGVADKLSLTVDDKKKRDSAWEAYCKEKNLK